MIIGVPDHHELNATATGWLNLAWDIVISEAANFQEVEFLYKSIEAEHGVEVAEKAIDQHWAAKRLKLNNAISLLQQSLEIFLKARIAEISPYLLISGDPQSWPAPDKSGMVDFADFRTLDALHLCRAAKIVSTTPISDRFIQLYGKLRKERNKITHLNAGSMKAEVGAIILEILEAHKQLFPDNPWVSFRAKYIISTGEYSDKEGIFTGDDYVNDKICSEVTAALAEIEPKHGKTYFQYDSRKKGLRCPICLERRNSDDEWRFAQKQKNETIKCIACLSVFDRSEYKKKIIEYFGYLDKDEQEQVAKETVSDLR